MPVIIVLPPYEIKAIQRKLAELMNSPEAFMQYLQKLYDEYALKFYNKIKKEQEGLFTFTEIDGTTKTGKIRRNGTNKVKQFYLGAECTVSICLIRFRCDSEHICREVILNIFVPYSRFLLSDIASIVLGNTDKHVKECFFHEQIRYVRRRWKLWQRMYSTKLKCAVSSVDDFFTLCKNSITELKMQLFQMKGYISAVENTL